VDASCCAVLCIIACRSYKVHVWVDAAKEAVRIDMRAGVDKTYFIGVSSTSTSTSTNTAFKAVHSLKPTAQRSYCHISLMY
jgi:hypothetical protein